MKPDTDAPAAGIPQLAQTHDVEENRRLIDASLDTKIALLRTSLVSSLDAAVADKFRSLKTEVGASIARLEVARAEPPHRPRVAPVPAAMSSSSSDDGFIGQSNYQRRAGSDWRRRMDGKQASFGKAVRDAPSRGLPKPPRSRRP
jgi:hypothetical protein